MEATLGGHARHAARRIESIHVCARRQRYNARAVAKILRLLQIHALKVYMSFKEGFIDGGQTGSGYSLNESGSKPYSVLKVYRNMRDGTDGVGPTNARV
jgi:hypothetical protein